MATRTWACNKEQNIADFGSTNRGNGSDDHAPVGLWSGVVYRDLMRFALDWSAGGGDTKVYRIISAELWVKRTGEVHVGFGGTPRVIAKRVIAAWTESGGRQGSRRTGLATVYPGPTVTGSEDSGTLGTTDNAWSHFDISSF